MKLSVGDFLELPKPFKGLYDWSKWLVLVAGIVSGGLYLIGYESLSFLGVVVAVAFALLYMSTVILVALFAACQRAEQALTGSDYKRAEEREPLVRGLRLCRRLTIVASLLLLASVYVLAVVVLYPVVRDHLRGKSHQPVVFEELRYFDAAADGDFLKADAFLESVKGHLESESGSKHVAQTVIGISKPLGLSREPVKVQMTLDESTHEFTCYAFLLRSRAGRHVFEPLEVSYSPRNTVGIKVPSCEDGDRLFLLGKLIVIDSTKKLPPNLTSALSPVTVPQGAP